MARRTVMLAASVLLAVAGTALVYLYARAADERAAGDQELVSVLFASAAIPPGTSAAEAQASEWLEVRKVPRGFVPEGVVRSADELGDQVALTAVPADSPVVRGAFGAAARTVGGVDIPDGKLAVAVQLSDPARLAGLLRPGHSVTVFASLEDEATGQAFTRVLLEEAAVLRVGDEVAAPAPLGGDLDEVEQEGADPTGEAVPATMLTLALEPRDAQRVIFAANRGELWFGLRAGKAPRAGDVPATTLDNLFSTAGRR